MAKAATWKTTKSSPVQSFRLLGAGLQMVVAPLPFSIDAATFRRWRQVNRLTQDEAAALLGYTRDMLSRWECGHTRIPSGIALLVTLLLKLDAAALPMPAEAV
jgi:DNA-binding transcriptional regulator YiaG